MDAEVRSDGVCSDHFRRLYRAVLEHDIDQEAWSERMIPGNSVAITTSHGFIAAHKRADTVNVWHAGVVEAAQGGGHFRELVETLLEWSEVRLTTMLTMTTRPDQFSKMFAILSACAHRCDDPLDASTGKARFRVPAYAVLIALRWRVLSRIALAVGFIGTAIAATYLRANTSERGVLNRSE